MSDTMRTHLVTKFVCSKCGGGLRLSYEASKRTIYTEASDDITGAAKVDSYIAIHPCDKCYGDAVRPLNALREALAVVNEVCDGK